MPYKHGFSPESIHHNIALFIREGYPQDQAVATALDIARKAWRREHPRGKYPAHLRGMRGPRRKSRSRRNMARRIDKWAVAFRYGMGDRSEWVPYWGFGDEASAKREASAMRLHGPSSWPRRHGQPAEDVRVQRVR